MTYPNTTDGCYAAMRDAAKRILASKGIDADAETLERLARELWAVSRDFDGAY